MENEQKQPEISGECLQHKKFLLDGICSICEEIKDKNWIDEMIIREATPQQLREGINSEFCQKWGVPESTYYWNTSKKENQDKIVELALRYAKKHTSDVLENLGVRAKEDNKAAELFIKFVLELAEKRITDLTSKGERLGIVTEESKKLFEEFEQKLKELKTK